MQSIATISTYASSKRFLFFSFQVEFFFLWKEKIKKRLEDACVWNRRDRLKRGVPSQLLYQRTGGTRTYRSLLFKDETCTHLDGSLRQERAPESAILDGSVDRHAFVPAASRWVEEPFVHFCQSILHGLQDVRMRCIACLVYAVSHSWSIIIIINNHHNQWVRPHVSTRFEIHNIGL